MADIVGVEMDCKFLASRCTIRNLLFVCSFMEHLFKCCWE